MLDIEAISSFSSFMAGLLAASVITIYLAKKYLQSFDDALKNIQMIQTKLTEISVKMDIVAEDSKMIHAHERKIAVLENEIFHGKQKCHPPAGKAQMRKIEDSLATS